MSYQCSPCAEVFTSLAGFDKHQDVDYSRRQAVHCLDPAAVGMTKNKLGRWQLPVSDEARTRLREVWGAA